MPNVLEIQIVGDVSGLDKSLKQAEKLQAEYTASIEKTSSELKENIAISNGYKKAVSDLNAEFKKGAISQKEYEKGLENIKRDERETAVVTQDLRKQLAGLKKDQKDLGGRFGQLSKKTADGSNALNQFSRIAQDAPFGIQGIGNNITATVEAFGHLQKSTGSAGAALKAVASSMLGSGGILLAVSLVTTGLTYMSQQGISVSDVFDKLSGTFDENANAIKKAALEGGKAASEEIINLKTLVSVAQNEALTKKERLVAVEKLQSAYPAYFGNLSKEAILNSDVTKQVDDLTRALLAKAVAEKLTESSAELQLNILKENAKLINAKNETSRLEIKLAHDLTEAQKSVGTSAAQLATIRAKGLNAVNASKEAEQDARDEIVKGTKALNDRLSVISKFRSQGISAETEAPKKVKKPKIDVTPRVTSIPKLEVAKSTDEENDKLLKIMRDRLSEDLNKLKVDGVEVNIPLQAVTEGFNFSGYAKQLELAMEKTQLFADGAGSAIGALGSELAGSLETGNAALDAFTGSVIQSFADIAAAQIAGLIAKQAIATTSLATDAAVSTGNAVTAATETAAASGPAAAFVLPALVGAAIGFIAASFAGIKFAHGGIVPGGSYTGDKIPAMLNSGEAVLNSQQQANTLMAVANGNANSLQGNRQSSNFTLETKLRGSDLLLGIKREERKR